MADLQVDVQLSAGSLMRLDHDFLLDHDWTDGGVGVNAGATGAHLLLVAIGLCVLNDVFREARSDIQVDGVRVRVLGAFDPADWSRTDVVYQVDVDSPADDHVVADLLDRVEAVAEIPRALRGRVEVVRR